MHPFYHLVLVLGPGPFGVVVVHQKGTRINNKEEEWVVVVVSAKTLGISNGPANDKSNEGNPGKWVLKGTQTHPVQAEYHPWETSWRRRSKGGGERRSWKEQQERSGF